MSQWKEVVGRGLSWPLPDGMDDGQLEALLFTAARRQDAAALIEKILQSRPHPQQGFRSCLVIMRLGKRYGDRRLESACTRTLHIQSLSYKSIESILKNGLDTQPLPKPPAEESLIEHGNIRGQEYYQIQNGKKGARPSC